MRELLRAAQGMERVIKDTPKPVVEQSQTMGAKRRDFKFLTRRPPLPKKGKSGQSSRQFQRRGESFTQEGAKEDLDRSVEEELREDTQDRESNCWRVYRAEGTRISILSEV